MSLHYEDAGKPAKIKDGAAIALERRGWAGCRNHRRDGEQGVVAFVFLGRGDDHVAVEFADGECIGFPLEFVDW